jgi:hypothetical protein
MIRPQPRPTRIRDEKYLAWIREQPCLVTMHKPCDDIEAHHIRRNGKSGVGTKPSDRRAVPLCASLHRWYHERGHSEFQRVFRVTLEAEISRLNREYEQLHPEPKVKREMKVRPVVEHFVIRCECRRVLRIPASKAVVVFGNVVYSCSGCGNMHAAFRRAR